MSAWVQVPPRMESKQARVGGATLAAAARVFASWVGGAMRLCRCRWRWPSCPLQWVPLPGHVSAVTHTVTHCKPLAGNLSRPCRTLFLPTDNVNIDRTRHRVAARRQPPRPLLPGHPAYGCMACQSLGLCVGPVGLVVSRLPCEGACWKPTHQHMSIPPFLPLRG